MPFLWLPVFTKMTSEAHGARRSTEPLDLRDLIETIPALVLCALADGSAEFANRAWQDYSGRPLQELTGSGWQSTIHPDDIAKFFHESTVALVSGKSIETEARLRRADGQYHWFSIRKTLAVSRSQNSEPSLRTLIACEDIEERKQEESARRYSDDRHRLVFETASDAVISLDETGAIQFANPATSRIFGYEPTELIGKPLTVLMPKRTGKLHENGFTRYLATGQRHLNWKGTEFAALRKNGQEFPVEVSFGELTKDGHRVFTGFIRDISERKRAEEKIRQSEAYLAEAQRLSQTGSFGYRLSTGEMFWSEETFRIYGYDRSTQPAVERVLQRVHPDDRPLVQEQIDRAFHGGKDCHVECRLLLPDDSVKHVRIVAHASKNDPGIIEFIGAVMDVTATKKAEEKLRRSEAYLAEAQKLSHTGSFGWDVSSGEIYWSRETFRIFECEPTAKVTIELILQRAHPEDRPAVQQLIERVSRERTEFDFEHRLLMADGSVKYLRVIGSPSENEDGCFEFVGAVTDITESKRAEEALRLSESYLAEAQRITHTGSWVWEVERRDAVHLSEEWYRIYGFDPAEGVPGYEKRLQRVHPEDRAGWQEAIERAIREESDYEMEYRILLPGGVVKYIRVVGHPGLDSSGEVLQFVGSSTDITESKRAEEALRRSEQRWETAFENSAIGMMMRDCSDRFIASNSVFQKMLGYTESELSQLSNEDVTYDEDRRANLELIRELLEGRRQQFQIEKRYRRKDGSLLWVRNNVALIPGIGEAAPFLFAVVEDITQRKQEESARRYSEERYRIVVETASDAVVSIDESSTILFVNPATSRIFGYDASELIGQPLTTLMPDYMRELHEAGFKRYLDTAERHINWQGTELTALRKNSEEFPVEVSFGELAINGRRLFTGFIRDITERKRAEEKIRQSEKELRQILDFTPQHVTVLGPDRRLLYNNHAALDYHGLTLEEWQTADPDRLFHPQDWERITREVYSKFLSGSSLDIEVRLRRRDGQYRWFLIRYNPTLDEQGRPTRWYAAATDIEDRKQAEQRLHNENVALREEIDRTSMFEEIVGISPALHAVLSRVSKVA